jgi:hypothetical protein
MPQAVFGAVEEIFGFADDLKHQPLAMRCERAADPQVHFLESRVFDAVAAEEKGRSLFTPSPLRSRPACGLMGKPLPAVAVGAMIQPLTSRSAVCELV